MSVPSTGVVRFEGYEIDRARWQLRYGDELLSLNRKTFDLLLYLMDHADRVVTKEELLRALWPESFIEESNLTQQVFLLRKALSRHEPGRKLIETVPGRGYRFIAPMRFEPRPETEAHSRQLRQAGTEDVTAEGIDRPEDLGKEDWRADRQEISHESGTAMKGAAPLTHEELGRRRPVDRGTRRYGAYGAIAAGVAVTLTVLVLYLLIRPEGRVHVEIVSYRQITHDGHAKALGGTDGSRIYFTRLEKSSLAQAPISGGKEALMPLALQDPWAGEVSPDGSTLLIISQAGGQGPAATLWALELVGGSLHRLGNTISSAWSPDGQEIVCASANGELFVMRHDGSNAHRIASVGGDVSSLAWSPDGHTIRFSRDGLLWQISPDGSGLGQLLPAWGKTSTQWSGQWASDGTYYFVADGQIWVLTRGGSFVRKEDFQAPQQLTYGPTVWDRPVPTPDGQRILASGRTRRGELVRFDPPLRQPRAFLAGISAEFVSFSSAAQAVAYVSYPEGVLWRANADGSSPVQLTESPAYPKSIRWSPDGSRLAFVDRSAESVAIFILDAKGGGKPQRLLPDNTEAENDPSWSPDGRKLVFSTSPNVGASGRSDLRVLDVATGKTAPLAGSEGLVVPRWSPDGHFVAAMTLDAKSLRLLDLSTGRWSSLDTGAVAFPEWSHDGRWIYYARWTADPALLRIRVADGQKDVLTRLTAERYTGFYTLWMGLDPEDTPMMLRDAGTDDIYALTLRRH